MEKYLGRQLGGRYQIMNIVGIGGMAVVYRAHDTVLKRDVAVKILKDEYARDPDIRKRFSMESQAVAKLSHQNIVSIYDVGNDNGIDYIVMELMEGITLKEYLKKKGCLSWQEALYFAQQICRALAHAHSRGIIHQDIKPQNIVILRDGATKLTDFGIASFATAQETRVVQEAIGSVHYVSPEQAKGTQIDYRTDIYSLGVVMYEMLTGRLPFEGETALQIVMQHLKAVPLAPSELRPGTIPPGMDEIVMHAMCANIGRRYASVEELFNDLERLKNDVNARFDYSYGNSISTEETLVIGREVQRAARRVSLPEENREEPEPDSFHRNGRETTPRTPRPRKEKNPHYRNERDVAPRYPAHEEDGEEPEPERFFDRLAERPALAAGIAVAVFAVFAVVVVSVLLFTGSSGGQEPDTETLPMPRLIGRTLEEVMADTTITNVLTIQEAEQRKESERPEGEILHQDPTEGLEVEPGTAVTVTVSAGSDAENDAEEDVPYTISDFTYKTVDDVKKEVEPYDITLDTKEEYSSDFSMGLIMRTQPAAGQELKKGATLTIYVSLGPRIEKIKVPGVFGMTEAAAKQTIANTGLFIGNITPVENDAEKGTVVWQSYREGTWVNEGSYVDLHISKGKPEQEKPPETTSEQTPQQDPEQNQPDTTTTTTPEDNNPADTQEDNTGTGTENGNPTEPQTQPEPAPEPVKGKATIEVPLPDNTDIAHVVILIDNQEVAYNNPLETNAGVASITLESTVGEHQVSVSIDGNTVSTTTEVFQ